MQDNPIVYRCTHTNETTVTIQHLFSDSVECNSSECLTGQKIVIYEVCEGDTAETLSAMLIQNSFFMFIAQREFDHIFLSLSKKFFFEFCHIDDPVEDLVIRYNTLVKYATMTVELQKKSEELENTIFELAFASTNVLEQNEFLEQLAKKDGLTMLYNHSYFKDRLKQEFDKSKRYNNTFAIALMDLDFFKKVNDTHGHLKGDEVLRTFALIIAECLRDTDIAARYGGEEFAIIFPETSAVQARVAVERIREKLKTVVFQSDQGCFCVTFSSGITAFSDKFNNSSEMIETADSALYMGKSSGRDVITVLL